MKKKYIFSLLLFFITVVTVYFIKERDYISEPVEVRQVFSTADLKSKCNIDKIIEETDRYTIKVYYPKTEYENLNNEVLSKVNSYIEAFKNEINEYEQIDGKKAMLEINFNNYEYNDYISYVFNIFVDSGGAHPNTYIFSISYNVQNGKIIKVADLIDMNKDILNILSTYSYNALKENEKIKEYKVEGMLENGTFAKAENFKNFAFDKQGIKIFFEKYSVAPYVAGEFTVTVPYDKLNLQ